MTSILIPVKSIPGYIFGANMVIVAQIYYKLLRGQHKFPRILSQNGPNDLEGQCQWLPNLVIPAQIYDELSCTKGKFTDGQTDGRSDGRMDGQTQATIVPLRPERSKRKKSLVSNAYEDNKLYCL